MIGVEEPILGEFLKVMFGEIADLVPKLIMGIIVIVVAFVILRILSLVVRKVLSFADVDGMIRKYTGIELPISFNGIVMALLYIGISLAVIYGLINIFLGKEYIELANSLIIYGARIISVVIITLLLFTAFSAIIERIKVESRLKGYLFFVMMLLLTAMLIDVTALSDPVKHALYTGLAIGIGASLSVFAVWFFFHEYFDKFLEARKRRK